MEEYQEESWTFYTMTFRISKQTDMISLKSIASDFWGLNDKNCRFYTETAEVVDIGGAGDHGPQSG